MLALRKTSTLLALGLGAQAASCESTHAGHAHLGTPTVYRLRKVARQARSRVSSSPAVAQAARWVPTHGMINSTWQVFKLPERREGGGVQGGER